MWVPYSNRGAAHSALGQPQRAIEDYDEALRIDPQDAKAYYNRGTVYVDLGQSQRAIEDFDEAIRLSPQYALAHHKRVKTRLQEN